MKTKNLLYAGISIALIAIAVVSSGYLIKSKPDPKKDNKKHNAMYVKATEVKFTETSADKKYRGRVTAFDNVSLAAEVQGKIMAGDVRFKAGESFSNNQVLIHIFSEDVEASLKSGKSSLLQTLSVILPDLKIDYPAEYPKWNAFFNSVDVGKPLPELPEIKSTKEKVFLAANNVLANYYSLQQQEIKLSRYTIRAPFTGSFKTVNKEIGAIASPGAELASIIRSDMFEVTVPVFPADLQWITKGDKVQVTSFSGEAITATVSRISGYVDDATQSVNVYLAYQGKSHSGFLQGEYVDVVFRGGEVSGFEIPREALLNGSRVYELKNGKLSELDVTIQCQLTDSYIIAGIAEGSLVVTESLASVNPSVEYLARK